MKISPVRCSSVLWALFLLIMRGLSGNGGPATNINTVTLPPLSSWKTAWQKPTPMLRTCDVLAHLFSDFVPRPTDQAFRPTPHVPFNGCYRGARSRCCDREAKQSSNSLGRSETPTSFRASESTPRSTPAPPAQHKRPPSPDRKRRDSDSHGPAHYKRARASSPLDATVIDGTATEVGQRGIIAQSGIVIAIVMLGPVCTVSQIGGFHIGALLAFVTLSSS